MTNASQPAPKKRILYVITKSNFGGAQRYVLELATAMKAQNYEVAVACGGSGTLLKKLHAAGITTFTIDGLERDISLRNELRALYSLWHIVKTYQPEILHLNSSKVGVLGSLIGRLRRVPRIVFTAHGWPFFEDRNIVWKSVAYIGSYLTAVLAHQTIEVSEHDHQAILPGTRYKRQVIPTGVDEFYRLSREDARRFFTQTFNLQWPNDTLWIGTVGEYTANKNQQMLIAAVAYCKAEGISLGAVLIGSGEDKSLLQNAIKKYDLLDCVIVTDYLDNARQYLNAFDIFLFPSKKEGMPYAILEAGKAGCATIASRVGGIPEVIEHQKNGLLIDPNNVGTTVDAIKTLSDSTLRTSYAAALAKTIETRFSLRTMIASTLACYEARSSRD